MFCVLRPRPTTYKNHRCSCASYLGSSSCNCPPLTVCYVLSWTKGSMGLLLFMLYWVLGTSYCHGLGGLASHGWRQVGGKFWIWFAGESVARERRSYCTIAISQTAHRPSPLSTSHHCHLSIICLLCGAIIFTLYPSTSIVLSITVTAAIHFHFYFHLIHSPARINNLTLT